MWVISKEGLIIAGVVVVLGVLGLALFLQPGRPPAPETTAVPPPAPAVVPVAQPVAPAASEPSTHPSPAGTAGPVTAIDGVIYGGEYAHTTQAAGFEIYWANDAQTLRIGLISPGLGYLAIGFDPVNRMEGANYILGAVSGGRTVVRDDFGTGPVAHGADTANGGRDDVLGAAGLEANDKTYFEFAIPLDSGDPTDRALVPGKTYKILIAYHRTDDDFGAWHSRRGAGTITLDPAP